MSDCNCILDCNGEAVHCKTCEREIIEIWKNHCEQSQDSTKEADKK